MPKQTITLEDIEKIPKAFLIPSDVAPFIGCDKYAINVQARDDPDKLGFPVVVLRTRVKIPKAGFIFFYKYGRPIFMEGMEKQDGEE